MTAATLPADSGPLLFDRVPRTAKRALSRPEHVQLEAILEIREADERFVAFTDGELAEVLNRHENTIRRHYPALEAKGYLTRRGFEHGFRVVEIPFDLAGGPRASPDEPDSKARAIARAFERRRAQKRAHPWSKSARTHAPKARATAPQKRAPILIEEIKSRSSEEEIQREDAGATTTTRTEEESPGRRRPDDPELTPQLDWRAFTVAAPLLALPAPTPTPPPPVPTVAPVPTPDPEPEVTPKLDWRAFTVTGGKDLPAPPPPPRKRRALGVAAEDLQRLAAEGDPVCRAELDRRRAAEPPPELPPADATPPELLEALESHPLRASLVSRTASAIVTTLGDSPQSFTGWLRACQDVATGRYPSAAIAEPLAKTLEALADGRTISDPGRYTWRGHQNWLREHGFDAAAAQKPTPGSLAKVVPGASGSSPIASRPRA